MSTQINDKTLANIEKATLTKIADLEENLQSLDSKFKAKTISKEDYLEGKSNICLELERAKGKAEGFKESLDKYVNDTGDVPLRENPKNEGKSFRTAFRAIHEGSVKAEDVELTGEQVISCLIRQPMGASANISTADGTKESIFQTQTVEYVKKPLDLFDMINKVGTETAELVFPIKDDTKAEGAITGRAEGAAFGRVDYGTDKVNRSMVSVGAYLSYNEEITIDRNQRHLLPYIEDNLLEDFRQYIQAQLYDGTGSSNTPTGFVKETSSNNSKNIQKLPAETRTTGTVNSSGVVASNGTTYDILDHIKKAATLIWDKAANEANLILLNAYDLDKILALKDDNNFFQFIFNRVDAPLSASIPTLWGVPVLRSRVMDAKEYCVMNTQHTALYYLAHQPQRVRKNILVGSDALSNRMTTIIDTYLNQFTVRPEAILRFTQA